MGSNENKSGQLSDAEVKLGYKKTEIGWIPEDWDTVTLGNATSLITNGFVGKSKEHYSEDNDSTLYIQGFNVLENSYNFKGVKRVSKEFHQANKKSHLRENDLLTVQTGDVGLTTIVPESLIGSNCHALIISRFIEGYHSMFFSQYFNSYIGRNRLKVIETGSTMKHLNVRDMVKWHIPLPPLKEQKKIAQILSTWDDTIAQEQKLIAQLKNRKKGLMQKLLTGELRLRDASGEKFSGEWKEVELGNIATRIKDKNTELNDNVVTISAQRGFVRQEDFFKKRVASDTLSGYYLIKKGHFAYNKSYSNGYPMGAFKRLDNLDKAVVTTLYICFELNEKVDSDFMLNYFEGGLMVSNLMKIAQEGGRAHGLLNIALGDFFSLKINIPPLEEQQSIARVLTTADQEIKTQEDKLAQLQAQKKGLMQQLLTGAKRVNVN